MLARVELISNWDDFFSLEPAWRKLYNLQEMRRPFQSWEWMKAWVEIYGSAVEPAVLLVRDENEIVGIAPFYFDEQGRGPFRGRVLRFLGDRIVSTEFQDILAPSGYLNIVWWQILSWLLQSASLKWDFLFLDDMLETAPSAQILRQLSQKLGLSFHRTRKNVMPVLQLDRNWDRWVKMHPNRDFISMTRNRANRLRKKRDVRVRLIQAPEEFTDAVEIFFNLHQKNWTSRGLPGSFATEEKREFFRRIGLGFLKNGWLEFRMTYLDGEPATSEFGATLDGVYYSLQGGYDPKFRKQNMGHFLFYEIIHAQAVHGIRQVEFLRGGETYKFSWGAKEQFSTTLWVGNHSLPGLFHPFYKRQKHRVKHWIKREA